MQRITRKDRTRDNEQLLSAQIEQLPTGYDDPNSDVFVPLELRGHFIDCKIRTLQDHNPTDLAERGADELALARALAEIGEAPHRDIPEDLDPYSKQVNENFAHRDYMQWVESVRKAQRKHSEALVDSEFSRMFELGLHHVNLDRARIEFEHAEKARKRRAQWERENTCPVCGECNPQQNGNVKERTLNPHTSWSTGRQKTLNSCSTCFDSALTEYRAALDREQCVNGVRGALVAKVVKDLLN